MDDAISELEPYSWKTRYPLGRWMGFLISFLICLHNQVDRVTHGAEFVSEMKVVSDHIFTKSKSSALTNGKFAAFIQENSIDEFYIAGADAAACVKSTCYNMTKSGYTVHVLSDCITSYDKKKMPELLAYYESKGCTVTTLRKAMQA